MPVATAMANNILNTILRNTSFAMPSSTVFLSLHTAAPGITGTGSPLASTPRFSVTFNAPANASCVNAATASVVCSATGTVTNIGLWDGSATLTATHIMSGALDANKTVANVGDTVPLASADLRVTVR